MIDLEETFERDDDLLDTADTLWSCSVAVLIQDDADLRTLVLDDIAGDCCHWGKIWCWQWFEDKNSWINHHWVSTEAHLRHLQQCYNIIIDHGSNLKPYSTRYSFDHFIMSQTFDIYCLRFKWIVQDTSVLAVIWYLACWRCSFCHILSTMIFSLLKNCHNPSPKSKFQVQVKSSSLKSKSNLDSKFQRTSNWSDPIQQKS